VGLGGWWFTVAVGVIVHLGLLEFFRMAQFKGIRPATKTTLVAVQMLLLSTQAATGSGWLAADRGGCHPAGLRGGDLRMVAAATGDRHHRGYRRVDLWPVLSGFSCPATGSSSGI
jgi:hypothetical protein